MKYASQLSLRTVVASGTGSSAAGLTATAVREGSSWALQVGSQQHNKFVHAD
jgi:DNA replicative helicase MCM subunit Mcm2 (Cdc46/Mcm family)